MFDIISITTHRGQVVIRVQHVRDDGLNCCREDYTIGGRQWSVHQRCTNDQGDLLMDDGEVAPKEQEDARGRDEGVYYYQYLPAGRSWSYHTEPHLKTDDILETIRNTHARRPGNHDGYNGWQADKLQFKPSQSDIDGCANLCVYLAGAVGQHGS
jgi:hypothetical protein